MADGCNQRCSYCIIPRIRGSLVSRFEIDILSEIRRKADAGIIEVNLVAQDLLAYGSDRGEGLLPVLKKMSRISGLFWIRLLYLSPEKVDDALLKYMARATKICRYLDIPFQHCDPVILKRMRRQYAAIDLIKYIERIRNIVKTVALRTTLMTGFPGETHAQFLKLMAFVENIRFDRLGVFCYWDEEEAYARRLTGKVSQPTKEKRKTELLKLQEEIVLSKNEERVGHIVAVLVEHYHKGRILGRTEFDAPEVDYGISGRGTKEWVGHIIQMKILGHDAGDLIGERV